jgi:hypothetical protein
VGKSGQEGREQKQRKGSDGGRANEINFDVLYAHGEQ